MAGATLRRALLPALLGLSAASLGADTVGWTNKHEPGRCALRGSCGKQSFFGGELPCPNNTLAELPPVPLRDRLVGICGDAWKQGPICCQDDQLDALEANLKRADPIISSCPACRANFYNLFCTLTCSPDQSTFLNVTDVGQSRSKKTVVTELEYLVTDEYGSGFFDSCKDVKFSAGYAMDFIGGGAKNYTSFLKFLGDKKALGSPFQINFPRPSKQERGGMEAMDDVPKRCNDTDDRYRCACVDCPTVCPELPKVEASKECRVGLLPCLSFATILIYAVLIMALMGAVIFHVAAKKRTDSKNERLRLLQDATLSDDDDDDEGDMVRAGGVLERPHNKYWLNTILDDGFSRIGVVCARFPAITIGISVIIVGLLSLGWIHFDVETDPVRLWVSPTSAAAEEKMFFDEHFGPFYRAEQAFLVNDTTLGSSGPVLTYETLGWWFDVENRVQRLKSLKGGVTLDDVCFKPTGEACVIQSVSGYFQNDFANVDPEAWEDKLSECTEHPGDGDCRPAFELPLKKELILGGWETTGNVLDAEALIVTWVVDNHPEGSKEEARAMDWEQSLKGLLMAVQEEAAERGLRLSFTTEISLEQELNQSTNTDAKIVVISYIVMFLYASLALGSTALAGKTLLQSPATTLTQSKFTLGVFGIIIVLMSVSASVGLFSACGVKVTLIIAEVIPFLVLAVGVDNIFLIVHEFERVNLSHPDEVIDVRVAKALGRMGPSILLSALTETVAFALGAFAGMPAVKNFAIYAAGAVFINAILQVTMFVAVLALNQRRAEDGRIDCVPCIKTRKPDVTSVNGSIRPFESGNEGALQRFIRKTYAPSLLGKRTKAAVLMVFMTIFAAALALLPTVPLGLDQRIAIPRESYLIPYFNDLYAYFDAGPPVYFVTRELNVTQRQHQQQLCGRFTTCETYSMANILEQERKRPEVSFIGEPAASWIDDFFSWLNPALQDCCVEEGDVCFAGRDPPWNSRLQGMPEGREFIHYVEKWVRSPTNEDCAVAGKAPYSNALVIDANRTTIPASHFRSSHRALRSQQDFIDAYAAARRISDSISKHTGAEVFPYSKFYIFFDQYASIVHLTGTLLGSAMAIILVITSVLLGSIATGLVVTGTVVMMVVDIIGTMAVVGVSLNAVSLVNLVICVGIGVEFCAHIARAFMFPSGAVMERAQGKYRGRDARVWTAMVNVGGSVFSGITITKLLGVCVLAFTRSKIFEIYYFRIWLALVVFAATHALIFLPVALSLFGGEGYLDPGSEGGLEEDLAARRYRALVPDDDYDSDDD